MSIKKTNINNESELEKEFEKIINSGYVPPKNNNWIPYNEYIKINKNK